MIRVAVVDDHPLFRSGVTQTLQAAPDIEVVAQGASVTEAIRISRDFAPHVLVLDMNLPEQCDAMKVLDALATNSPAMRILVLTVVADRVVVRDAISRGAGGYVLKGIGGAEFLEAVRAVHRGEGYVTPTLAASLFAAQHEPDQRIAVSGAGSVRLSAREDQILSFLAKGLSNKEIGLRLDLSEKTVKHYVTNLFQKMHVRNRTQAALRASGIDAARM